MEVETTVSHIIPRTYNVKSFRFPNPASFTYKPGQFLFVTIKKDGTEMRKHFTISSSPTEDFLEFTKKITDSEFSSALDKLEPGDWARIKGPYGTFTFEGEYDKIAMLSGGIGITPLRSILKFCKDTQLDTDIVVLYGNTRPRDIVFREELESMPSTVKVVLTVEKADKDWSAYTGRIDRSMIENEIPDYPERVFFICGPPGMVNAMHTLLKTLGVSQSSIRKENFTGY